MSTCTKRTRERSAAAPLGAVLGTFALGAAVAAAMFLGCGGQTEVGTVTPARPPNVPVPATAEAACRVVVAALSATQYADGGRSPGLREVCAEVCGTPVYSCAVPDEFLAKLREAGPFDGGGLTSGGAFSCVVDSGTTITCSPSWETWVEWVTSDAGGPP
jgi:hypothetical protein